MTKGELEQFTGTENYYRHWSGLVYTDGVQYLAANAGAYWFLDLIASHQREVRRKLAALHDRDFQSWTLEAVGEGWRVRCDNGNGAELAEQRLEYTDFPAALLPLTLWVIDGVVILKSEY